MIHLNGNLLCAVDVETTGIDPEFNELIQVAILPLDENIKPLRTVDPFYYNLTPRRLEHVNPQACKVTKKTLTEILNNSIDPDTAADRLDEWFERLNLPITPTDNKKIMPLWTNGGFDKSFLRAWLGPLTYDHIFHFHERDTQSLALSINDRFWMHGEPAPFPKVGLGACAAKLEVINANAHDALQDCITTAEVYRRMLLMYQPIMPQ